MKLLLRQLLNAIAVFFLAQILKGVHIDHYMSAIMVALALSVLNLFIKPLLVVLTRPITLITLGLFLLVINAVIIMLTDKLIQGFSVDSLWTAWLFSFLLSLLQSLLLSFIKKDKNT